MQAVKRILTIVVVIIAVLAVAAGAFFMRYNKMADTVKTAHQEVTDVDLSSLSDGSYNGQFGDFLVSVDLTVKVQDHRIADIVVNEQSCGKGYEALETIERIKHAQSPKVDAVTGATGSSMSIMVAAHRALTSR